MFIFFLTVARYVEMVARHQSTQVSDSLSRMLPVTAHRVSATARPAMPSATSPSRSCEPATVCWCAAGEVVPADGRLERGSHAVRRIHVDGRVAARASAQRGDRADRGHDQLSARRCKCASRRRAARPSWRASWHCSTARSPNGRASRGPPIDMASRFLACVLTGAVLVARFGASSNPAEPLPRRWRCWWSHVRAHFRWRPWWRWQARTRRSRDEVCS